MESQPSPTFTIVALPKLPQSSESDSDAIKLARKFRDLRLLALKTAPEAFAASYEVESLRETEHTIQRLKNPKAIHFVAVDKPLGTIADSTTENDFRSLLDADWVGMIVLLGPETEPSSSAVSARSDPFSRMTATTAVTPGPDPPSQAEGIAVEMLNYHLNGVFVSPSARKSGLGRALIAAALARANAEAQSIHARVKCSILVDSENAAARGLYERAGFVVVGEETYVQQPRALVAGEAWAQEKVALLMELEQEVTRP